MTQPTILLEIGNRTLIPLLATSPSEVIPQTSPSGKDHGFVVGNSVLKSSYFGHYTIVGWIRDTLARNYSQRTLSVYVYDQIAKTGTKTEMLDCSLTEANFPGLDKSSKAEAVVRLVVKAGRSITRNLGASDIRTIPMPAPLKRWKVSDFDFVVDGLDTTPRAIQTVSSLTLKQLTRPAFSQRGSLPEPTRFEGSNVSIRLPLEKAASFLRWSEAATRNPSLNEKTATLRYLTDDGRVIASAYFESLGIVKIAKTGFWLEVQLYFEGLKLDQPDRA
jgi:hypothetical protein